MNHEKQLSRMFIIAGVVLALVFSAHCYQVETTTHRYYYDGEEMSKRGFGRGLAMIAGTQTDVPSYFVIVEVATGEEKSLRKIDGIWEWVVVKEGKNGRK